jgi:hypothetical protein
MTGGEYSFLQNFFEGDRPLTLGILLYVVWLLHKSDQRQTKAINWLRKTLIALQVRVNNLEKFNERLHPNDWRHPPNIPDIPIDDNFNFLDENDD